METLLSALKEKEEKRKLQKDADNQKIFQKNLNTAKKVINNLVEQSKLSQSNFLREMYIYRINYAIESWVPMFFDGDISKREQLKQRYLEEINAYVKSLNFSR